jgi:GT2 family glycosyltransferase
VDKRISDIRFFPLQDHDQEEVRFDRRLQYEKTQFVSTDIKIIAIRKIRLQQFLQSLKSYLSPNTKIGIAARHLAKHLPRRFRSYLHQNSKEISNQISDWTVPQSSDLGYGILTSTNPIVSVIIPVFNGWEITDRCLKAIRLCQDLVPFEIIVVDDASKDQTSSELRKIRGIHVITKHVNSGYLLSNNEAARYSRGKYLMLLNNDTEPITGWLDNSVDIMEKQPTVAIVGSKLLYPNGNVQEAGGQVFSNGNAWNLGRSATNKSSPEVCSVREVDYCSAAALLVRRDFWVSVGGFDVRYTPAYYEDTDLCFSAWENGYKVIYQPESIVVHHEGMSNGKSTDLGIKRYQTINQVKFSKKWAKVLTHHWQDIGLARLEHTRASKGIVVLIDAQLPSHFRDSGSQRTLKLIDNIQALGFHVVLGALDNSTSRFDVLELRKKGIEVHFDLEYLFSSLKFRSSRLVKFWLVRSNVIEALSPKIEKDFPEVDIITDLLDLEYAIDMKRNVVQIERKQLSIVQKSKKTVLVSPFEVTLLQKEIPNASVVDLWTEFEERAPMEWEKTSGVLFLGGFRHKPNVEALEWFIDSVLPALRRNSFQHDIRIVGSGLSDELQKRLQQNSITYLGFQKDLDAVYHASRVVISPLQFGRGLKGKIGEALSYGIPIVGTNISFEGFKVNNREHVIIEDEAIPFADAIMMLHSDQSLWQSLSSNSRKYWESNLALGTLRERVSELLQC